MQKEQGEVGTPPCSLRLSEVRAFLTSVPLAFRTFARAASLARPFLALERVLALARLLAWTRLLVW